MAAPNATVHDALRHAAARLPDLLAPGRRLLVGYSGGQDSTCLLHALAQRDLDVVAAHVDHGVRPESADQAQQAVEIARSFGVTCHVRRIDLGAYQATTGWGVQQAARAVRVQLDEPIDRELGHGNGRLAPDRYADDPRVSTPRSRPIPRGCTRR